MHKTLNLESSQQAHLNPERIKILAQSLALFLKTHNNAPSLLRNALHHAHYHPEKSFGECVNAVEPETTRARRAAISQAQREIDALMAKGNPDV